MSRRTVHLWPIRARNKSVEIGMILNFKEQAHSPTDESKSGQNHGGKEACAWLRGIGRAGTRDSIPAEVFERGDCIEHPAIFSFN
jgi:hypothetical protein